MTLTTESRVSCAALRSIHTTASIHGSFGIDPDHVRSKGALIFASGAPGETARKIRLSAEERMYFSLAEAGMLNQCLLEPKHVLLRKGQPVSLAYFIMHGSLLAKQQNKVFRLGGGRSCWFSRGDCRHAREF